MTASTPRTSNAFQIVGDMENNLATAADLAEAITIIVEHSDTEEAGIIQRLAWMIKDQCDAAERQRCDLSSLTHPNREHFEKVGWPS